MTTVLTAATGAFPTRALLITAAALRGVVSMAAIPLAPILWRDHFLVLVLLRPTKEVLLAAGFGIREGDLVLPVVTIAVVPLMVLGVWLFFALGKAYAEDLRDGELSGIAGRVLPAKRIKRLGDVLDRKGRKVVFLGRLAVFPSALMATAAGVGGMSTRDFLLADGLGALASLAIVLGVGYGLGEAYEAGGPWLTAVGVLAAVGLLVALGRWLKSGSDQAGKGA